MTSVLSARCSPVIFGPDDAVGEQGSISDGPDMKIPVLFNRFNSDVASPLNTTGLSSVNPHDETLNTPICSKDLDGQNNKSDATASSLPVNMGTKLVGASRRKARSFHHRSNAITLPQHNGFLANDTSSSNMNSTSGGYQVHGEHRNENSGLGLGDHDFNDFPLDASLEDDVHLDKKSLSVFAPSLEDSLSTTRNVKYSSRDLDRNPIFHETNGLLNILLPGSNQVLSSSPVGRSSRRSVGLPSSYFNENGFLNSCLSNSKLSNNNNNINNSQKSNSDTVAPTSLTFYAAQQMDRFVKVEQKASPTVADGGRPGVSAALSNSIDDVIASTVAAIMNVAPSSDPSASENARSHSRDILSVPSSSSSSASKEEQLNKILTRSVANTSNNACPKAATDSQTGALKTGSILALSAKNKKRKATTAVAVINAGKLMASVGKNGLIANDIGSIEDGPSIEKHLEMFLGHCEFEEPIALEELERFARVFKQKRIKLGFTQGDVGLAMGKLYGTDFSQTTISRFEALNLSFKNMCKLKPVLEKWIKDTETAVEKGTFESQILKAQGSAEIPNAKRRKKRTSIEGNLRSMLEEVFQTNSRPSMELLETLAQELNMDREVIRVWFCNRRQKEKRVTADRYGDLSSSTGPSPDFDRRTPNILQDDGRSGSPQFLLLAAAAKRAAVASLASAHQQQQQQPPSRSTSSHSLPYSNQSGSDFQDQNHQDNDDALDDDNNSRRRTVTPIVISFKDRLAETSPFTGCAKFKYSTNKINLRQAINGRSYCRDAGGGATFRHCSNNNNNNNSSRNSSSYEGSERRANEETEDDGQRCCSTGSFLTTTGDGDGCCNESAAASSAADSEDLPLRIDSRASSAASSCSGSVN